MFKQMSAGIRKQTIIGGMAALVAAACTTCPFLTVSAIDIDNQTFPATQAPLIAPETTGKYASPSAIVQTDEPAAIAAAAKARGIEVTDTTDLPGKVSLVTLDAPGHAPNVSLLKLQFPGIKISPNHRYQVASHITPNDPRYGKQWNLEKIQAPAAWDITTGSADTVLAVVDTGVLFAQTVAGSTYSQPDFPTDRRWTNPGEAGALTNNGVDDDSNGFVDDWQGWDFMGGYSGGADCPNHDPDKSAATYIDSDNDPQPYSCDSPDHPTELNKTHYNGGCTAFESACYVGHGTLVGSTAAAATNNGEIIASIDHNAAVMNLRVLDGYGFTSTDLVTKAVRYAAANGADVINLSLAVSNCSQDFSDPVLEDALLDAKTAGVTVVVASGNGGGNIVCYPASSPNAIAVGASTIDDERASFSTGGPALDVIAPGSGVPAANAPSDASPANYYSNASGTSLSTPHVAGLASLIKATAPEISAEQTRHSIIEGATKVAGMNGSNRTDGHGYGRISVNKSLQLATLFHPDGTLIKSYPHPTVYLIEDGERRPIASATAFLSHGFEWHDTKSATPIDDTLPVGPNLSFAVGTILKGDGAGIYAVNKQGATLEKRVFTSMQVFSGLGYGAADVRNISSQALPQQNGPNINTKTLHPEGTLVKPSNSSTIYLLADGQKQPFPSPKVFLSHGYKWGRVKTATAGDNARVTGQTLPFAEGTLLQGSSTTIYIVDITSDGTVTKRAFASWLVFTALDYQPKDVVSVNNNQLPTVNGAPVSL